MNVSGNVDFYLSGSSSLSVRGGLFTDNYADTGVSTTTSVIWNTPSIGVAGVPANLQLPKGAQNTPRVLITNKDQTDTSFVQVDYNHAFNAAGSHVLKGGVGLRHTTNEVDATYPGGYVLLNWGTSFVNTLGQVGTGTYGYYEVNDRGTRGAVNANMPSLYVQDTWTAGQPPDPQPRRQDGARDDSLFPDRRQRAGVRVRLRQENRPASGRDGRRAGQRPAEGVRELGPVLRLGQVRARPRIVWRRYLAGALSLARHAGRQRVEPGQHAGARSLGRRARSARAELRHDRPQPQADVPGFDQPGPRVSAEFDDGDRRELRAQQAHARDRGRRLAGRDRQ